jgi:hypothetical protein
MYLSNLKVHFKNSLLKTTPETKWQKIKNIFEKQSEFTTNSLKQLVEALEQANDLNGFFDVLIKNLAHASDKSDKTVGTSQNTVKENMLNTMAKYLEKNSTTSDPVSIELNKILWALIHRTTNLPLIIYRKEFSQDPNHILNESFHYLCHGRLSDIFIKNILKNHPNIAAQIDGKYITLFTSGFEPEKKFHYPIGDSYVDITKTLSTINEYLASANNNISNSNVKSTETQRKTKNPNKDEMQLVTVALPVKTTGDIYVSRNIMR